MQAMLQERFQQLLTTLQNPAYWWQMLILLIAVSLSAMINARLQSVLEQSNTQSTGFRHLAVRGAQRIIWPLTALVFILIGVGILENYGLPTAILEVVSPILAALALIRLCVYILRQSFASNPIMRSSENILVLLVWSIVIMHLLGWLPPVLRTERPAWLADEQPKASALAEDMPDAESAEATEDEAFPVAAE